MIDLVLLAVGLVGAGWLVAPPRGDQRGWLVAGLFLIWGTLIVIGWRRGILAGFEPWLILLTLMAALAGLMVVWSAANLRRPPKPPTNHDEP